VKKFKVTFRPAAERDLIGLHRHVEDEAGLDVADDYSERIEEFCLGLDVFPERGTRRDDLRRGVRIIGFERRATIAFQVLKSEVVILRVLHGGQDYERILRRGLSEDAPTYVEGQ
jgi:toxin ParE1/3/4